MDAVTAWVKNHTFDALKEKCSKAGVPISTIYNIKDCFEDPQYQARHDIVDVPCEEFGHVKMPGIVPVLSETPGSIRWPGQKLGSANEEVYGKLLGLSEEKLQELKDKKII